MIKQLLAASAEQLLRRDRSGPGQVVTAQSNGNSRNALVTAGMSAFPFPGSGFSLSPHAGQGTQNWSALVATATLASIPAAATLVLAQRYIAARVTGAR